MSRKIKLGITNIYNYLYVLKGGVTKVYNWYNFPGTLEHGSK